MMVKDAEEMAPLSITTANTGLSVLFVSRYFPPARSTDQIRNAIIPEYTMLIKGMGYQYEDAHVHMTFVARVAAKKATTHFPSKST